MLDLVAEKAGWKKKRAADEVYGMALHESFNSVVGQVAKLKKTAEWTEAGQRGVRGGLRYRRESEHHRHADGVGHRLRIVGCTDGRGDVQGRPRRAEQLRRLPVLRINEMPAVETHIVPSKNKPTGVGEPGTPVIAPALANALAQIDGKPVRVAAALGARSEAGIMARWQPAVYSSEISTRCVVFTLLALPSEAACARSLSRSAEERIEALIAKMALQEKAGQLSIFSDMTRADAERARSIRSRSAC